MEFDPSSRFKLVDQAVMLPGKCLITGNTNGKFIDTGVSLNKFDGMFAQANNARVYLSVDVVREMAEGAGLFDEFREKEEQRVERALNDGYVIGVLESGELASHAKRLGDLASRLQSGSVSTGSEVPGADTEDSRVVFVTDGPPVQGVGDGPEQRPGAGRQGDDARGVRRPARVPGGSGDARASVGVS